MISYRDTTFCPFYADCADACERSLTDEVKAAARRWWGSDDAPIAQYEKQPPCHREMEGASHD